LIWRSLLLLALIALPRMAPAQEAENGAILTWIEDSISTPDRMIRITGVEGALSSSARIAEITISDADGVWLQILGAEIDWSRAALFSARLDITSLHAQRINVFRRPLPITTGPTPEAAGFTLPDLPVDIQIDQVTTDEINLGEGVVGTAASLSLAASFRLDTAGLAANITATRTDGPGGQVALTLGYDRVATQFDVAATISEPANGVIANALQIEGTPALQSRLSGHGVLDDLTVTLAVDVDAVELISGQVTLSEHPQGRQLTAQLNGQIAGLLPAPYRGFFNSDSALSVAGLLRDSGGVTLDQLTVSTAQLQISGRLDTFDDGFPRQAQLNINISADDSGTITLPFGSGISLKTAQLELQFGQASDGSYALNYTLQGLNLPGFAIAELQGEMQGTTLNLAIPASREVSGTITGQASGVMPDSAATAAALGDQLALSAQWDWVAGGPLNLRRAVLQAQSAAIRANGAFSGVQFTGDISAAVLDMRPFSALAGRDLTGALALSARGSLPLLGGQIDAIFAAQSTDLQLNQPQLDALLKGEAKLSGHVLRNELGLALTDALFNSTLADLTLSAQLDSTQIALNGQATLTDLAPLIPQLTGSAQLGFALNGPHNAVTVQANLAAESGLSAQLSGEYGTALNLVADFTGLPLNAAAFIAPDLGLGGQASGRLNLTGTIAAPQLGFNVTLADLVATPLQDYNLPPLAITASGTADANTVQLTSLSATGGSALQLDLSGRIPLASAGLALQARGQLPLTLSRALLADAGVGLAGQAQFDMAVTGALTSPQFTGQISTTGASLAIPAQRLRLDNLNLSATLAAQTLTLTRAEADVQGGGRLSLTGQIGLGAGLPANLELDAQALRYSDGELFTVLLNSRLAITGPLATSPSLSGQVDLLNAEIQVPSGSAMAADLPDITHINVPRPVRRTQQRAGIAPSGQANSAPFNLGLNLTIAAPGRVFVRGRGLDTELGGTIQLTGSLNAPLATGQFNLLRGRMDLLGQRIEFTEGNARFAGNLEPVLDLRAVTRANEYTINLQLAGPATAPEIILSSSPDLPQDEILAQLIFARGIDSLSPFQIAQLAAGVAELSGRSNGGLISNLRRAAGLDNLDVQSAGGNTSVTAGSYLRDNVYSEVELNSNGSTNLSINIDIIDGLTGRAQVGSNGDTGLGVYFERDY